MTVCGAELLTLAERCERTKRADRELDIAIATGAAGWRHQPHVAHNFKWHDGQFDVPGPPPKYTTSLDAAVTLVPEGYWWRLYQDTDFAGASMEPWGCSPDDPRHVEVAYCHSPALALCAAALKAKAGRNPKGGDAQQAPSSSDESGGRAAICPNDTGV